MMFLDFYSGEEISSKVYCIREKSSDYSFRLFFKVILKINFHLFLIHNIQSIIE